MKRKLMMGLGIGVLLSGASHASAGLIFTEYREPDGSSSAQPRFFEVTNVGNTPEELSDFSISKHTAGAASETTAFFLPSGTLAPGQSFVVVYSSGGLGDLPASVVGVVSTNSSLLITGDDAFRLYDSSTGSRVLVDSIGDTLGDPGDEWNVNGVGTRNTILRRKPNFTPDTNLSDPFDPSDQWIAVDAADISDVGQFVPEPSSLALLGFAGLVTARRRRRSAR